FTINQLTIFNSNNTKTFSLNKVEVDFSWRSLLEFKPILDKINIYTPKLKIQKNSNTEYLIGGVIINFNDKQKNTRLFDWLLNQDDIVITDGEINWIDKTRPSISSLILKNVNLDYQTSILLAYLDRHSFKLSFDSSATSLAKTILTGHFNLDSFNKIESVNGQLSLHSDNIELNAYKPWIDYPIDIDSGTGNLTINASLEKGKLTEIETFFDTKNVRIKNNRKKQDVLLKNFSGQFNWYKKNDNTFFNLNQLTLVTNNDLNIRDSQVSITLNQSNKEITAVKAKINRINLKSVQELTDFFPLENESVYKKIKNISPEGKISNIKFAWEKTIRQSLQKLTIDAQLLNVKVNAHNNFPSVKNITGQIHIKNNMGFIKSVSRNVIITKLDTFRQPLKFSQLTGKISWNNNVINLKNIIAKDEHMKASINGSYKFLENKNSLLDIEIIVPLLSIPELKIYYPRQLGNETLGWLDTSLLKGTAENTIIKIQGQSKDFPFVDENNQVDLDKGKFTIQSTIKNSFIEYGDGWPEMENFDANLHVEGAKFSLISKKGRLHNNQIKNFEASIIPFTTNPIIMNVDLVLDSPVKNIIYTIKNSPINKYTKNFFKFMDGEGPGELNLNLTIPFDDIDNISFVGTYELQGSAVNNTQLEIPQISNLKGIVNLSNNNVTAKNINGVLSGEPLNIQIKSNKDVTTIDIKSTISNQFIKKILGENLSRKITGRTQWSGKINLFDNKTEFLINSDLVGIQIRGLSILDKSSNQELLMSVNKTSSDINKGKIDLKLGTDISATFNTAQNENKINIINGIININSVKNYIMPKDSILLVANFTSLSDEDFMFLINDNDNTSTQYKHIPIDKAQVSVQNLALYGFNFSNSQIELRPNNDSINIQLKADGVNGNILWDKNENLIKARFDELHMLERIKSEIIKKDLVFYNPPKMDIKIQSFKLGITDYGNLEGRLNLTAFKENKIWNIKQLKIVHPNSTMKITGFWDDESLNPNTSIKFNWNIRKLDKTLEQLEMNDLVDKGKANIRGYLSWPGSPMKFDKLIVDGTFSIDSDKGTILEGKPGVGRLLGLLTLQNLPRRLQLDFRDLFSKGMLFDEINGSFRISEGNLNTDNFEIDGPAAAIQVIGKINLIEETQDLLVSVTPRITDTLSLAALAGGPIAGAAAWIAQKILDDPLNKVLTDQYRIIGTWDDPIEVDIKQDNILGDIIDEQIINPTKELFDQF
ncbi:MAG: YhdP family protein, partial [Methylophilaceae bacterium]